MAGAPSAMFSYIIKRILATIPVMGVVALFVFLLLRLSPGDPAAVIAGDYATSEDIARIREQLCRNEPICGHVTTWICSLVSGVTYNTSHGTCHIFCGIHGLVGYFRSSIYIIAGGIVGFVPGFFSQFGGTMSSLFNSVFQ